MQAIYRHNGGFIFDGKETQTVNTVPNIKDIVKVGQEIMVQVVKAPIGTKGARVTTNITLDARLCLCRRWTI
ncbi:MAG: hypothetical protein V8Q85_06100 [Christensenellales bacterium]